MTGSKPPPSAPPDVPLSAPADWVSGYKPLPGIPDEFIGRNAVARPHWTQFFDALGRFEQGQLQQRFAAADRSIRDMAISYRAHGEASEQSWPLSRLPLLIAQDEWREIAEGVAQRAEVMNRLLGDLYGPGKLVASGALPAAAVAGSRDFLRPLAGMKPAGDRWLNLYAAEIGRGPDGRWWVLGDRAQAPSGMGYALENRLRISQALPALYRDMNVERLAPFFVGFRSGLAALAERSDPRICLMSAGPLSQTYFEQAYLARYLGFLLVEGDDLVAANGQLHVRTIAGLKRADVVWRRVDGEWCDPLELDAASRIGVPGMIAAIRSGAVAVTNVPGAGLVESRAMLGFLPKISRELMGEDLKLPHVATWWCGQESARKHVLEHLDRMAISSAFGETVPGFGAARTVLGSELTAPEREALRAAIALRGVDYVGQEIARLSTMPRWENGRLEPRPFVLRVFAAATPEGWVVMPGGFCRVSDAPDARAVSMGAGVQSADVWIVGDTPVAQTTLLPQTETIKIVRLLGNLPSRAADNLFWYGRYLERSEAILRVIRCLCGRGLYADRPSDDERGPLVGLEELLARWRATPEDFKGTSSQIAARALRDPASPGSALSLVSSAKHAASVIRERLSQDMWRMLGQLEAGLQPDLATASSEPEILERTEAALQQLAALAGLIGENVNRVAGWSFLDIGRRIERGINTCRLALRFADADADNLDVLLDLIDSQITYRSRYITGVAAAPVLDMAVLDPFNPRSVAYQVTRIDEHLAGLPSLRQDGMLEEPRRLTTALRADLSIEEAANLSAARLAELQSRLFDLGSALAARYFLQGPNAVRAEKLMGLG